MNKKGVTFLEMILVLVIIAIGASLAVPKLRRSVENREAKAALETLRIISHAIRMYELNEGALPPNLVALETASGAEDSRYLNPNEYAPGYQYDMVVGASTEDTLACACKPSCGVSCTASAGARLLTLRVSSDTAKGQDGAVIDSAGFLSSP